MVTKEKDSILARLGLAFILLAFIGILSHPAYAQFTNVSAVVQDSNGNLYTGCSYSVDYVYSVGSSQNPLLSGSPFQMSYGGAKCDSFAAFSIRLPDNNSITPTGSKWRFSICDSTGTKCFTSTITITGASQVITSTLSAVAPSNAPLGGAASLSGNNTFTGVNNFKIINTVRYADQFTGADIGARVNAAFTDCSNACIVRVPAGSYSYSTTINVPEINGGNVALELNPGAYLTYTGTGDAILITPANAGVINSNSIGISGGQLIGTSTATSGIHLQATARNTITGIDITGFSTGSGIFCEGCINNQFISVQSRLNRIGYKEQPISMFASTYTNNANVWVGGHIQANTLFGVAAYIPPAIASGGVAANFFGVTIEGNGESTTLNATAAADNATCASAGMCLNSNVVTVTTTAAHGFVVGQLVDQTATGTCFSGRYVIASVPSSTTYTYTCVAANAHTGAGTIKGYSGNVFLEGGNNESFIGGYMEPAVNDGTVKATIYLGDSNFAPSNVNIRNVNFQSLGVVNTIDNFNGGVSIDGNREGATNTNFFNQEVAGGLVNIGYNAVLSTNYLVGNTPVAGSIVFDPSLKRLTYYGGQFNSTVATGTPPLLVSSATPVTTLVVANHPQMSNCGGVATTCPAFTTQTAGKIVEGSSTFSAGAVTIGGLPFSSNLTYECTATDLTALNVVKVTSKNTGASVTFGGTGTDNFSFICAGN